MSTVTRGRAAGSAASPTPRVPRIVAVVVGVLTVLVAWRAIDAAAAGRTAAAARDAGISALALVALAGAVAGAVRAGTSAERAGRVLLGVLAVLGGVAIVVAAGAEVGDRLTVEGLPSILVCPLAAATVLAFGARPVARPRAIRLGLDAATILVASAGVAWWAVLRPVRDALGTGAPPDGPAFVLMTVGAAATILALVALVRIRRDLRATAAAVVVGAGLVLVGDLVRAWSILPGSELPAGATVVLWSLGAAAFALGAWATPVPAPRPRTQEALDAARRLVDRVAVPHLFALALGVVLLIAAIAGTIDRPLALSVAGTILLLAARQAHEADERTRLTRRLTASVAALEHGVDHDDLTGLLNRHGLVERLDALPRERPSALVALDLDRFKDVNDAHGHAAGDAVLCGIARRLGDAFGADAEVARLAADEFCVLLPGAEAEAATSCAHAAAAAVREPLRVGGGPGGGGTDVLVTASVGIALRDRAASGEETVRAAALAMLEAKRGGRGRITWFDRRMRDLSDDRQRIEQDLRRALADEDTDEVEVHLQPLVALADDHVWGAEALVRWRHPEHGLLPPGRFLPVAEESGLIVPLGLVVLDRACEAAASVDDLVVSVNLSPRQIRDETLVEDVRRHLERHGLDADRLCLEVTEDVLVDEATVDVLSELRALGVRVAIDDFGVGASSLHQLRRVPGALVKIDRAFTAHLDDEGDRRASDDRVMISALVTIARQLGLEIVAEGLERPTQRTAVVELGVHIGQGWLLGRPVAVPVFLEALGRRRVPADRDAA